MVTELKQHIILHGDNPLDAVMVGTNLKAYLIASFAMQEGIESVANEYEISQAAVHAALAFHYDNEEAIRIAREEAREQIRAMGGFGRLEEIRRRQQKSD
ncbi:MAG: hypothetical protein Q9P44_09990 [Anaerolineae bacterium]|nr:hypothetical protein [Anaerolineae bacterium]